MAVAVNLDRMVVVRGAAAGALLAVTAALANVVLAGQDPKPGALLNLTLLFLVLGFIVSGLSAGLEATQEATRHGAAAAMLVFLPVEIIGVLGRLDRGEGVSLFAILFVGLLAASAGTLGALLGARRKARRSSL